MKTSNHITLPIEHKKLIVSLRELPDTKIKLHTKPQRQFFKLRRERWKIVAVLIDYKQIEDYGYKPSLIGGFNDLHPKQQEELLLVSNLYYCQLQIIINQFDYLRDYALNQKREFPFADPRQLFAKILRECANSEFTEQVCNDNPQNLSLTDIRQTLNHHIKFWRDILGNSEKEAFIESLKNSVFWSDWWIYPTWKSWQDSKSKPSFRFKFCFDSHIQAMKMYKKSIEIPRKHKDEPFFSCTHWQHGYPSDPKSKCRVDFSLQNVTQ